MKQRDPTRWRAPSSDACADVRALLAEARPPRRITRAERADVAARVARTAAPVGGSSVLTTLALKIGIVGLALAVAAPYAPRVAARVHAPAVAAHADPSRREQPAAVQTREASRPVEPPPRAASDAPRAAHRAHARHARRDAAHTATQLDPPVVLPALGTHDPSAAFARLESFVETYRDAARAPAAGPTADARDPEPLR